MVVHMFNPHVPEADIVTFLQRYMDILGAGQKIIDEEGYWTSKRRYMVRFHASDVEVVCVMSPPANFNIRPNRGYVLYPGQPRTCRRCGQLGHISVDCTTEMCRGCGRAGHVAAGCKNPLVCNLCGEQGQTYRMCPKKARSFASVVS
uniref:CCHC-type domain-containing protein n=1 Tax=Lepisosteus oculatus TaxID=7918 RepID=W5NLA1_LEPOC